MIWKIAQKDLIEMWRDGRFRTAALILFALLAASMLGGWKYAHETKVERSAAQDTTYDQWLNQGKRNAHSATHFGMYAFKPLSALAFVDKGVDGYTGTAVFMESHKQNEFLLRPAKDTASIVRFGELTVATVLQFFIPLLIVILAFAAFSGERESGTLRQALSLGVSRFQLGIGKVAGIALGLFALLLPATLGGVIVLLFLAEDHSTDWARGAWMVGFYLVYYLILLLIALAISSRFSSRVSLVLLLGFWIISTLIVPRGAADAAKRMYPTPSSVDFSREMQREILDGESGRNEQLKQRVFAEYKVERIEDLPFNFEGLDLQDSEEKGNYIIDFHYGKLDEIFVRQDRVQEIAAAISPAQAIRLLSQGLAGTDIWQQTHFVHAAENYRREMVREMNRAVEENVGEVDPEYRGTQSLSRQADRATWEGVPPFGYRVPDVEWVLRNHFWSIGVLAVWLIGAVGLALWAIGGSKID